MCQGIENERIVRMKTVLDPNLDSASSASLPPADLLRILEPKIDLSFCAPKNRIVATNPQYQYHGHARLDQKPHGHHQVFFN